MVILADSGYQGIHTYHEWSLIPIKKSKNHLLSEWEKLYNMELLRRRMMIEHVNAKIKFFKMMSYPYRNRRKRHKLRILLICAVLNREKKKNRGLEIGLLQGEEEFIANGQFRWSSALRVLDLKGLEQEGVHSVKGLFLYTEELLEHRIAEFQDFNDSIWRHRKKIEDMT